MNYPVWQLDGAGGGLLIILVAVLHVFISHFAVGGGLFLVLTEHKGLRENSQAILDFVKKHTRFFLLLTMVLGGMTGVGIWFTIALLNPAATSVLIHLFVFGWAIEWVFFLVEIVSLFVYYYTFGRMDDRNHLLMGWIYFGAAWMSLFVINGIIDFMLTPGAWLDNGGFWSAFFNPTFWPALFFRTFLALIIAGMFGMVTATWLQDRQLRTSMLRYSGMWLLAPFVLLLASAWWYKSALPTGMEELIFSRMPEIRPVVSSFAALSALLVLGGLLLAVKMPRAVTRPVALAMLGVGLVHIGTFEFVREGGRRPYIIREYMYSNSILRADMEKVRKNGVLSSAKWVSQRKVEDGSLLASGRELFSLLCLSCHALNGPVNDIVPLAGHFSPSGMEAFLRGMGRHNQYMPPFAGNAAEARALAYYLTTGLHGSRNLEGKGTAAASAAIVAVPVLGDYLLLAWPEGGGLCLGDGNDVLSLGVPPQRVSAQLLRRGSTPEVVGEDVVLRCLGSDGQPLAMEPGEHGVFTVSFSSPPGTGMHQATVEALDGGGRQLAVTRVLLPPGGVMGCANCHGGAAQGDNAALLTEKTANNILKAHDKISKTSLVAARRGGATIRCQLCHPDGAASGNDSGQLGLSAAIHGFHAALFTGQGDVACHACHTSGRKSCLQDIHRQIGLGCQDCHGSMEQHSASLLRGPGPGRERAGQLLARLEEWSTATFSSVHGRLAWVNQPDCLNCHQGFEQPSNVDAFNVWTTGRQQLYRNRLDDSGRIRCVACHGALHAMYPAEDGVRNAANHQPWQYQGNALPIGSNLNCAVCHQDEMTDAPHHPNMERTFRNEP